MKRIVVLTDPNGWLSIYGPFDHDYQARDFLDIVSRTVWNRPGCSGRIEYLHPPIIAHEKKEDVA